MSNTMSIKFRSKQGGVCLGHATDTRDYSRNTILLSNNLQFSKVQKLPPITEIAGTCVFMHLPLTHGKFYAVPTLNCACHIASLIINTKSSMQDRTISLCLTPYLKGQSWISVYTSTKEHIYV